MAIGGRSGRLARIAGLAMGARVASSARVAMGAWRAGGLPLPLAVLLALLRAVLLREVRDTVPNPMRPGPQRVLTALHLSLDLLPERAVRRRGHRAGGATSGEQRRQDGSADLALDAYRHRAAQPSCHGVLLLLCAREVKTGSARLTPRRPVGSPSTAAPK